MCVCVILPNPCHYQSNDNSQQSTSTEAPNLHITTYIHILASTHINLLNRAAVSTRPTHLTKSSSRSASILLSARLQFPHARVKVKAER